MDILGEKQARYNALIQLLNKYEYWTSKHVDGEYTEEEWAEKVAMRKAWREEVRQLETEFAAKQTQ